MSNTDSSAIRKKRIAQGLCGRCGKFPLFNKTTLCVSCRDYRRNRWINRSPEEINKESLRIKKWTKNNPVRRRILAKQHRTRIKMQIIEHYGGKCACCGETNIEFLTIDHINGGGIAHRKALCGGYNLGGFVFYAKLKAMGYPSGLQILCWNCNVAKFHCGICPHKSNPQS